MDSTKEKIWLVKQLYRGAVFREAAEKFYEFPDRPKPAHTSIIRCIRRVEATRRVDYERTGNNGTRPEPTSDVLILAVGEANPRSTSRFIGEKVSGSHFQVIRRWHKYSYNGHKTSFHQELFSGDAKRRLEFAISSLELIGR